VNDPNVCEKAMNEYGNDPQYRQAAEELGEALVAVLHAVRGRIPWDADEVAEELADVQIMIDQLLFVPGLRKKFDSFKEAKLARLKGKLEAREIKKKRDKYRRGDLP